MVAPNDPPSQRVRADCQAAVAASAGKDPGNCRNYVIWPSDDEGKTPTQNPKMGSSWPYTQTDKIKATFGPFINTYKPHSALTYVN